MCKWAANLEIFRHFASEDALHYCYDLVSRWSCRPAKGVFHFGYYIVRIFLKDTRVLPEEPLRNFRRKPLDYLASERSQENVLLRFPRRSPQLSA